MSDAGLAPPPAAKPPGSAAKARKGAGPARLALAGFAREQALLSQGIRHVAGIDEVGRGPLAGPVVAAAVILDPAQVPAGLADSKLLAREAREALFEAILATGIVGVASVSASHIDEINIRQAALLAMRRACAALAATPGFVLVDGNDCPAFLCGAGRPIQAEAVIGGDALIASIAAASIVAKVTRDRMMHRLARHQPAYGFDRHVGYATPVHRAALATHGPCPFHRYSFAPIKGRHSR